MVSVFPDSIGKSVVGVLARSFLVIVTRRVTIEMSVNAKSAMWISRSPSKWRSAWYSADTARLERADW